MATRAAVTKQLARTWVYASVLKKQAQDKKARLISSQGKYTFFDQIDTHPYSAQEVLAGEMQAKFQLFVEGALAVEVDGVAIWEEADRIAAGLIVKSKPQNAEINLLRGLKSVNTPTLSAHDVAQALVDAASFAWKIESTCGLVETKKLLLQRHKKKALSTHLEVPYIDMKPTAKSLVRNHRKLVRMLLDVTVSGNTIRSAMEQLAAILTLSSSPLSGTAAGLAGLKAL